MTHAGDGPFLHLKIGELTIFHERLRIITSWSISWAFSLTKQQLYILAVYRVKSNVVGEESSGLSTCEARNQGRILMDKDYLDQEL